MTNYIGIDISKRDFHASFSEDTGVIKFTNDRKGIKEFLQCLKQREMKPEETVIGMESTGHYHLLPAIMCSKKDYRVNVINPIITKNENRKSIRRVKTDSADARLIRYCAAKGEDYSFRETEASLKLKSLVRQRNYLSGLRAVMKLRQQNMDHRENCIKQSISSVNRDLHNVLTVKIKELDKELLQYSKDLQKLLRSIPGVGPQTAVSFVSEIGDINRFPSIIS